MPSPATRQWRLARHLSALRSNSRGARARPTPASRRIVAIPGVLLGCLLGCLFCAGSTARAQGQVAKASASATTHTNTDANTNVDSNANAAHALRHAEELYLEVTIRGQTTSLISRFVLRGGHMYVRGDDLKQLGFRTDALGITPKQDVSLEQLHVPYTYNANRLTIDMDVPDALRTPNSLNARDNGTPPPSASALQGVLLNYDVYSQTSPQVRTAVYAELRYFSQSGVFSQTGILDIYRRSSRFIRYETSWTQSKQSTLSTLQLGDTITGALDWSRAIRIGGVQWRRNFALRPDLISYPIPSLRGSTAVPSAVDLYINDVRQFSSQVPSGPFVLNQVPGISGAGVATVITRDALGRSVATSVPLYVDTRLLASGLSSYSFEAGFLRRNYGEDSFDYQRAPAFSATGAYGFSDALTLNAHAEGTGGVANAGAGAYVGLGQIGVVNGSLSASVGHGSGQQFGLGYQLIEPRFSINLATLRVIHRYRDIATRAGDPVPISTDRATISLPFISRQTIALSYIGYKLQDGPIAKIGSINYMIGFGSLLSLNVSVFHDFGDMPTTGVFVGMNLGLGYSRSGGSGTSINTNYGRTQGVNSYSVNATKAPDYGGGFGWGVQAGRAGHLGYQQAQAQYLGNIGEITVGVQSYDGHAATSLDLTGALVFMDKTLFLSRRIDDSFAVISTDGVGSVPVLHDNRVIGKTSPRGYFLIPDLNAYEHNQISIDPMNLPADTRVTVTKMDLVPESHAGVLGHFGIAHFDAATVILRDRDGHPIPAGTPVMNSDNGQKTIVGYGGQVFIDALQPQNHLRVGHADQHCDVAFTYQHSTDGGLHTIGPLRCNMPAAKVTGNVQRSRSSGAGTQHSDNGVDGLAGNRNGVNTSLPAPGANAQ